MAQHCSFTCRKLVIILFFVVTCLRGLALKRLDEKMILVLRAGSEVIHYYVILLEPAKVLTLLTYGQCLSMEGDLLWCQLVLSYPDRRCWPYYRWSSESSSLWLWRPWFASPRQETWDGITQFPSNICTVLSRGTSILCCYNLLVTNCNQFKTPILNWTLVKWVCAEMRKTRYVVGNLPQGPFIMCTFQGSWCEPVVSCTSFKDLFSDSW